MIKSVPYEKIRSPTFKNSVKIGRKEKSLFDLSSHERACDAIHFALKMRNKGFHVFVVGDNYSGRMSATLQYLEEHIKSKPSAPDWVYLNNFSQPNRPLPFSLPPGEGESLKAKIGELITGIKTLLDKILNNPESLKRFDNNSSNIKKDIEKKIGKIQQFAKKRGFEVLQTAEGFQVNPLKGAKTNNKDFGEIKRSLQKLSLTIHLANQQLQKNALEFRQQLVKKAIQPIFIHFHERFDKYLKNWIDELKQDILEHIDDFFKNPFFLPERYSVNLFIDNSKNSHPKVVLEPNPTYENLFGSIQYKTTANGAVETNFTMIRQGALHRAYGGILIIRAETLVTEAPYVWDALKVALRDRIIRIEEPAREKALPLCDAPKPKSIPLDLQVFLIGSPHWYYNFFINDPEFRTYFNIKADIDPDLPATGKNVSIYKKLIEQKAFEIAQSTISKDAVDYLIGHSARWANHRERLSAKFKLISEIIVEASAFVRKNKIITKEFITKVLEQRRLRHARVEDRIFSEIEEGHISLNTEGKKIGQINALSVLSTGDHFCGIPSRISARTYIGETGIVNIERITNMSGPIQQKAILILEGFINSLFSQKYPLSYSCSITFEQSYSGVEGDSASMAELIAILSSLSRIPIRQDIAITGSMDQVWHGTISWRNPS
ncbi:MAG: AAA family ATPase [Alphaproteobacteria bacterium]